MSFELYNIADNTTGEILSQIGADVTLDANAVTDNTPSGTTAYLGLLTDKPSEWYYVAGVKTARPAFSTVGSWNTLSITADGVDDATFGSSLPNPTTAVVVVPSNLGIEVPASVSITTGSFTLTTDTPGKYQVTLDAFPYMQETYTITAT